MIHQKNQKLMLYHPNLIHRSIDNVHIMYSIYKLFLVFVQIFCILRIIHVHFHELFNRNES